MTFWSAVVTIVAIIAFSSMRMARWRAGFDDRILPHRSDRRATAEALSRSTSAREIELQKEVDDLRQRIAVLERIATEDRHSKSIAHEIESLRDK